jgi:hypothetical protein
MCDAGAHTNYTHVADQRTEPHRHRTRTESVAALC